MSIGGDTAEQVTRMGLEVTEQSIKLVCLGVERLAALIAVYLSDPDRFKGNTSLKNLLKDGRSPFVMSLTKDQLEAFKKEAGNLKLPYCKVKNPQLSAKKGEDMFDVIVRQDDLELVKVALNHIGLDVSDVIYEGMGQESPEDRRESVRERTQANRDKINEGREFTHDSLDDLEQELFTPDMLYEKASPLDKNININTISKGEGIEMICGDDMLFKKYLELQAWNPETSVIELADVFSRYGQSGALYLPEHRDILIPQSTGLVTAPNFILMDGSPEMSAALSGIIRMSPAKIYPDGSLSSIARYNSEERIIRIDPQMDETALFSPISREMALALYHKNQGDSFSRDNMIFEANGISAMLANRFGLPYGNVGNVAQKTSGASLMGKARFLESMRRISGKIGKGIVHSIQRAGRIVERTAQPQSRDDAR